MAKPDCDDGWFMLAYELLPPLMMCCSRVEASIVLCEVLAQTYGRGKHATARLQPAKIAERSGRQRQNIWRGIKELTDAGIITRLGTGDFRFQKDYSKWRSDKELLVDKSLAQYFAAFPSLAKSYREECRADVTESRVDSLSKKANGKSGVPRESNVDSPRESNVDSLPPIREIGEGNTTTTASQSDSSSESESSSDNAALEPFEATPAEPIPTPVDARPAPVPGELRRPFRPDPAELERVRAWVLSELGPDNPAVMNVGRFSPQYPLAWIEQAIEEALSTPGMRPNDVWRYAYRCLSDWWKLGGPPKAQTRVAVPRVFPGDASAPPPRQNAAQANQQRMRNAFSKVDPKRLKDIS